MPSQLRTAWIWAYHDGTSGMTIDIEKQRLEWFVEIGCACGDSSLDQSYAEFLQRGAPVGGVPDDILSEIEYAVRQLKATG
ncbi:MAG: hypothetical protein L0154_30825 [Chloroflexi bacterium]|nr:hypothetical protein [Chloroflexota bacterium]